MGRSADLLADLCGPAHPADYPPGKSIYARRSVEELLDKARSKGEHIGVYAERILAGPLPWARMRTVYALLGLCGKYGDGRVEAICQSALSFDVVDVARIRRMLKRASTPKKESSDTSGNKGAPRSGDKGIPAGGASRIFPLREV